MERDHVKSVFVSVGCGLAIKAFVLTEGEVFRLSILAIHPNTNPMLLLI
jgi:hypothetical protein